MTDWQPIETAPKDRPVLVSVPTGEPRAFMAEWRDGSKWLDGRGVFVVFMDGQPLRDATHWKPAPEAAR